MKIFRYNLKAGLGVKLVTGFLIIALVPMAIAAFTAIRGINEGIEEQAQLAVNNDLNSANEIFQQRIKEISLLINIINDENLATLVTEGDIDGISHLLSKHYENQNLCILTVADAEGDVIYRAASPERGDNMAEHPWFGQVLAGNSLEGPLILEEDYLEREGLAEKARLKIMAAEEARPSSQKEERRGMVLISAAPVFDQEGEIRGSIIAGDLINNNFQMVDQVGKLLKVTSTVFLDDLRISTNVRTREGTRATGTRVSEVVAREVLDKGERYLGKAFVVTEDYITAYDPIRDPGGEIIGINYVGIREAPFVAMKNENLTRFIVIAAISLVLALGFSAFITGGITRPVRNLMKEMKKAEEGDLSVEVHSRSEDELGHLANSFNNMLKGQREMIRKVLETTTIVSQSSQDLSASVEESNATMQEISSTIDEEVAKKAQDISIISNRALESGEQTEEIALQGGKAVEESVKAMGEINGAAREVGFVIGELEEASEQIGVIVNTITGIADQTNLLALNAAIEAARAGEQGRGFAVVAAEVRKLAEGSSAAAGEIGDLITNIQGKTGNAVEKMEKASEIVEKGTRLGEKAREHLQQIKEAVNELGSYIKEIAAAAEDQTSSTEEIAASTQQQTRVLEDISRTTNELASRAEELAQLIDKFKINEGY
ncbi:MAG: HAMP domain-containing protein [Candidatus Syntrophonatronum acetioxidans]|uniref:HAMP domain-containing protein n=1 Tax=Candidatus Syntrophonatronum acetioxidans TaxID=1795816 RepID=A0A424YAP1_9FIRM|nr:MAG: HAMP domain-containing protein [Candidatus Syntrophonatronum acetioxidans]